MIKKLRNGETGHEMNLENWVHRRELISKINEIIDAINTKEAKWSMKEWTDEELDELHGSLWAFLSFIDEPSLRVMGKYDERIIEHVTAIKKSLDERLSEHGGRFYKKTVTQESQS